MGVGWGAGGGGGQEKRWKRRGGVGGVGEQGARRNLAVWRGTVYWCRLSPYEHPSLPPCRPLLNGCCWSVRVRVSWAERHHKPHPLGPGELRQKHGTKRDPHQSSHMTRRGVVGGAMISGAWAYQVITARTNSDVLGGLKKGATEAHDYQAREKCLAATVTCHLPLALANRTRE